MQNWLYSCLSKYRLGSKWLKASAAVLDLFNYISAICSSCIKQIRWGDGLVGVVVRASDSQS